MNQQELATCHCIISHPSKPKFLVIRHDDRWSPPMFGIPAGGPMSAKAPMINENMWEKYGLRTRVLRHWVALPNYHCVELELQPDGWTRRLDAVWVGLAEYGKFRRSTAGSFDPMPGSTPGCTGWSSIAAWSTSGGSEDCGRYSMDL